MNNLEVLTGGNKYPSLHMKETDPDLIDSQIKAGLVQHGGKAGRFLNNMHIALPGGSLREIVQKFDMLDTEFVKEDTADLHSDRAKTITMRQYFEDIDAAVDTAGIRDQLAALQDEVQNGDWTVSETISELALQPYKLLRQQGYSHYDLWR